MNNGQMGGNPPAASPSNPPAGAPMTGSPRPMEHKHHNKLVMAVFIIVAVLVAVLLMFLSGWIEITSPTSSINSRSEASFEEEINEVDTGDLDGELIELDAAIENL